MVQVCNHIAEIGFIPKDFIQPEVNWFYNKLGIDDMYFLMENVQTISKHIMALYGAKVDAWTRNQNALDISLEKEEATGAIYIHSSVPGISQPHGPQYEKRIDAKYLDISDKANGFRLEFVPEHRHRFILKHDVPALLLCRAVPVCCTESHARAGNRHSAHLRQDFLVQGYRKHARDVPDGRSKRS